MLMRDLVGAFAEYQTERNRSPRTRERYGRVLDDLARHLERVGASVESTSAETLGAFLRRRADAGRPLAPATRNVELAILRSFWRFLRRRGVTDRDPTAVLEFARIPRRDATYLTLAEFDDLVAAIKATASRRRARRDIAIVTTGFHTGLRLSEFLSLNEDQVDWEELTFRAVVVKGGSCVDVAFNHDVADVLRRLLRDRPSAEGARPIFGSSGGRRLSPRAVQLAFKRYLAAAGIAKGATPHSLRHSTATHLLAAGENLLVVAEQLHHQNLNTTRRYVRLAEGTRHRAVARLAARVRSGRKARREVARRNAGEEARP